ncbi:MAG: hypothetical protein EZS28_053484, partial [Streblomastix strix]
GIDGTNRLFIFLIAVSFCLVETRSVRLLCFGFLVVGVRLFGYMVRSYLVKMDLVAGQLGSELVKLGIALVVQSIASHPAKPIILVNKVSTEAGSPPSVQDRDGIDGTNRLFIFLIAVSFCLGLSTVCVAIRSIC